MVNYPASPNTALQRFPKNSFHFVFLDSSVSVAPGGKMRYSVMVIDTKAKKSLIIEINY